jgi:hypothetical protein
VDREISAMQSLDTSHISYLKGRDATFKRGGGSQASPVLQFLVPWKFETWEAILCVAPALRGRATYATQDCVLSASNS